MKITKHAVTRIRQRLGVKKKERARELILEAWKKGQPIENFSEALQKHVREKTKNTKALIHKGFIYVYDKQTIITAFTLPSELAQEVAQVRHKKIEKVEEYKSELEKWVNLREALPDSKLKERKSMTVKIKKIKKQIKSL